VVQVILALIRKHGPAFAAYLVIGGLAALAEWAVFLAMWRLVPAAPLYIDSTVAFVIATFVNYLLCVRTIYASKTGSVLGDVAKVYAASLLAFGVNQAVFLALVAVGANPMAAKIAGTGVAFLVNFAARQFVIFAPALQLRLGLRRARQDSAE
jgi:putative flippase GtrA